MTLQSKVLRLIAGATLLGGLAACGTTTTDRAVSGAGIGAATGAVIGATVGAPGRGAAIGAAAGAAAGALSDPCKVNLGAPYWRDKHATRQDYYRRCGHYPPR